MADECARPCRSQPQPPSLEAVAAARYLSAEVCLAEADDNDPLRSAAKDLGVEVRTISD
jgi:hypothetical protein